MWLKLGTGSSKLSMLLKTLVWHLIFFFLILVQNWANAISRLTALYNYWSWETPSLYFFILFHCHFYAYFHSSLQKCPNCLCNFICVIEKRVLLCSCIFIFITRLGYKPQLFFSCFSQVLFTLLRIFLLLQAAHCCVGSVYYSYLLFDSTLCVVSLKFTIY